VRQPLNCNPPTCASWVAGIIGMYHHNCLVFEIWAH
jgi:hypothetical protein